jgi:hypothetical protein
MPGSQNPNIINVFDPLILDQTGIDLPEIDTGNLVPTYKIHPGFLNPIPLLQFQSISINGGGANVDMGDAAGWTVRSGAATVDINQSQVWSSLLIQIAGGTTSPITVQVILTRGGIDNGILLRSLVNPGSMTYSGMYISPGYDVSIITSAGGAGDVCNISANGFQIPAGMEPPATLLSSSVGQ